MPKRKRRNKLTRSERKLKTSKPRKMKPFTVVEDGVVSMVSNRTPIDELAWAMAQVMTASPRDSRVNLKSFCPRCKKYFCMGFDNVEVYCETCFYFPCPKDVEFRRRCKTCGGKHEARM